ncbi:MAG TPA: STAS domain-containing protein [Chitinivibrionales bacterium]|nr:STAS domain-containing protein [Chitinivibrionales bacterium]
MATLTYKFGEKLFLGNADALSVIVDKMFENRDAATIVFDMENVKLCDSYGLKFLINYQRRANSTGKKLVLYRPDQFLREMFASTKLSHFFFIADALDDMGK